MIKILNFYEYLKEKGIKNEDLNIYDLKIEKINYKRYRNNLYKKRQRLQKHAIELFLEKGEYNKIKNESDLHKLSIGLFIKQSTLAYLNNQYLIPDRTEYAKLVADMHAIRVNIEKLTHTSKGFLLFGKYIDYESLVKEIDSLKNRLELFISQPVNLDEYLSQKCITDKEFRRNLLKSLIDME